MVHFQRNPDGSLTIRTEVEVQVPAGASMLDAEECLMTAVNKAGAGVTGRLLEARDAVGKPLTREGRTFTARRGKEVRPLETPSGCAVVERRAYQSSLGGVGHYPLDRAASLMGAATPKFAQMVSRKPGELPAAEVVRDLRAHHSRSVSLDFVQSLTGLGGALAEAAVPVSEDASLPPPEDKSEGKSAFRAAMERRGRRAQRTLSAGLLCGTERRGGGLRAVAARAHGKAGARFLSCQRIPACRRRSLCAGSPQRRGRGVVVAGGVQSFEARGGSRHLLSHQSRPDELCGLPGSGIAHWQRSHGSGLQTAGQKAALRPRDDMGI